MATNFLVIQIISEKLLSTVVCIYLENCHLNQINRHFEAAHTTRRMVVRSKLEKPQPKGKDIRIAIEYPSSLSINRHAAFNDSQWMFLTSVISHFDCISKIRFRLSTTYQSLAMPWVAFPPSSPIPSLLHATFHTIRLPCALMAQQCEGIHYRYCQWRIKSL